MNLSLYENASALRGLEQYQNVVANNIAASHVAGFKKVAVSFEAVEGGEIARSTHDRLRNEMPGSFPVMKNQIDFVDGEMRETNNPQDLALRGMVFLDFLTKMEMPSTLVMVSFIQTQKGFWSIAWDTNFPMWAETIFRLFPMVDH